MEKVKAMVEKLAWATQEVEQCMEQLPKDAECAKENLIILFFIKITIVLNFSLLTEHRCSLG
jgi:hypothetical protein